MKSNDTGNGNGAAEASAAGTAGGERALRQQFHDLLLAAADPQEVAALGKAAFRALADLGFRQCMTRTGAHSIHIGAGTGRIGHRRMPVVVVADDRPFLVESVVAAFRSRHLAIHRLLAATLAARRDEAGRLVAIDAAAPGAEHADKLILLEVERVPARERARLVRQLELVLGDVGRVVADWPRMRQRLLASAAAYGASAAEKENAAFLEWLLAGNFVFLGVADAEEALGLFRDEQRFPPPGHAAAKPGAGTLAIATSTLCSTVRRPQPMTILAVTKDGNTRHFLGLFTSAALREKAERVPIVRRKIRALAADLGIAAASHEESALLRALDTLPLDDLLQTPGHQLETVATGLLTLLSRPRPQLFFLGDRKSRHASVFVYLPYDRYSAHLRDGIDRMLEQETGGAIQTGDIVLRSEGLARIAYRLHGIRTMPAAALLQEKLIALAEDWADRLERALGERLQPLRAAQLALRYGDAFPLSYQLDRGAGEAADDVLLLHRMKDGGGCAVALDRGPGDAQEIIRLKIARNGATPLSESVPLLENFGFRVLEERSYPLQGQGMLHLFKLALGEAPADLGSFRNVVVPAIAGVLDGTLENDSFNSLIPSLLHSAREIGWFRAWFRYLRQTDISYSIQTIVHALRQNAPSTNALLALFRARHRQDKAAAEDAANARRAFEETLDRVTSIDDDRILRLFGDLIAAILRTNAFLDNPGEALAFKIDPHLLSWPPKPLPWREIWVYAPRVEGIHLRNGPIARGGIRWSDRRDDFRTEILDLMRTQTVKNAVIVPTGAKGGFFAKQLPDPKTDRDGWAEEGRAAYRIFIRALLALTDNLDEARHVVPPAGIARLDGDDPYFVVAADKGTAHFSDTANAIARDDGYWLDDAFASGGSTGYDHKGMGITARGAWISVMRHFQELGVDVQKESVNVVGVGDMSGDVFGNGMLQSRAIRLVAAFDHRHIFLDPHPDPAQSHKERARLYALPRSSWDDYDRKLLSKGGGVFPRTRKSIPLSPEVRASLGIAEEQLAPTALITAILKAPVDLLFFGGIGTYVKGAAESDDAVGDNANKALRIHGAEIRARVVGEGANLGCTQAGRIEYARQGGRINADFIDNSAGVDTSDHEVNLKIAFSQAIRSGRIDRDQRNRILASMRDEVALLVLENNREQTRAISLAEGNAAADAEAHIHLIETLEESGRLDPEVEGLPTLQQLRERKRQQAGLTRPEIAILLSYVKMELRDRIALSPLPQDALCENDLFHEFPASMQQEFAGEIRAHPLRPQIVGTMLGNFMVNHGGLTFAHQIAAESGATLPEVAGAFVAARALFDLADLYAAIDAATLTAGDALFLRNQTAQAVQQLVAALAREGRGEQPGAVVARQRPGLDRLLPHLDRLLQPESRKAAEELRQRLLATGAGPDLVGRVLGLHRAAAGIRIAAFAARKGIAEGATAEAYTRLGEALGLGWVKLALARLVPADHWERLLAASTAESIDGMRFALIGRLVAGNDTEKGGAKGNPSEAVDSWLGREAARIESLRAMIADARAGKRQTLPMLVEIVGVARRILASGEPS